MKKQMLISGIAVLAAAGMVLTGCNKDDSSSSESTAETTAEIATATTEETAPATEAPTEAAPELKIIGAQAEGDSIYQVTLQNHTGKEITGVSVKDSSQEEFPENMQTIPQRSCTSSRLKMWRRPKSSWKMTLLIWSTPPFPPKLR